MSRICSIVPFRRPWAYNDFHLRVLPGQSGSPVFNWKGQVNGLIQGTRRIKIKGVVRTPYINLGGAMILFLEIRAFLRACGGDE